MKLPTNIIIAVIVIFTGAGIYFSFQNTSKPTPVQNSESLIGNNSDTQILQKPRDKIIAYTIQNGDSIASIAQKFKISESTIRWENNLTTDTLTEGQKLRILPVTGVSHRVVTGDTIQSLAEKYKTTQQKIIDFPFNEYANPDSYKLIPGTIIVIPDGVK